MNRADVRRAFRTVMAADYADVPPAEEIRHVFSGRFLAAMDKLIAQEKRGSWHLLSRQRRRALIVAAILAAALLLTACSPTVRRAVTELVVSFRTHGVDFFCQSTYREEIETVYVLGPVPEGFALVSQTQHSPYFVETYYEDGGGTGLILHQAVSEHLFGFMDTEQGEVQIVGEGEDRGILYFSEKRTRVSWIYDGYYMYFSYLGPMDKERALALTAALVPMEAAQQGGR